MATDDPKRDGADSDDYELDLDFEESGIAANNSGAEEPNNKDDLDLTLDSTNTTTDGTVKADDNNKNVNAVSDNGTGIKAAKEENVTTAKKVEEQGDTAAEAMQNHESSDVDRDEDKDENGSPTKVESDNGSDGSDFGLDSMGSTVTPSGSRRASLLADTTVVNTSVLNSSSAGQQGDEEGKEVSTNDGGGGGEDAHEADDDGITLVFPNDEEEEGSNRANNNQSLGSTPTGGTARSDQRSAQQAKQHGVEFSPIHSSTAPQQSPRLTGKTSPKKKASLAWSFDGSIVESGAPLVLHKIMPKHTEISPPLTQGHSALTVNGKVVIIGGALDNTDVGNMVLSKGQRHSSFVNCFESNVHSWILVDAKCPANREGHTCCRIGDTAWIYGGLGVGGLPVPPVEQQLRNHRAQQAAAPFASNGSHAAQAPAKGKGRPHSAHQTPSSAYLVDEDVESEHDDHYHHSRSRSTGRPQTGGGTPFSHQAVGCFNDVIEFNLHTLRFARYHMEGAGEYRARHCSTVIGDKMYSHGGWGIRAEQVTMAQDDQMNDEFGDVETATILRHCTLDDLSVFDPVARTWTPVITTGDLVPLGRASHTMITYGTSLVIFGGLHQNGNELVTLGDTCLFNTLTKEWSMLPCSGKPPVRKDHSTVLWGNKMIVVGGTGTTHNAELSVWSLDLDNYAWVEMETSVTPKPMVRASVSILYDRAAAHEYRQRCHAAVSKAHWSSDTKLTKMANENATPHPYKNPWQAGRSGRQGKTPPSLNSTGSQATTAGVKSGELHLLVHGGCCESVLWPEYSRVGVSVGTCAGSQIVMICSKQRHTTLSTVGDTLKSLKMKQQTLKRARMLASQPTPATADESKLAAESSVQSPSDVRRTVRRLYNDSVRLKEQSLNGIRQKLFREQDAERQHPKKVDESKLVHRMYYRSVVEREHKLDTLRRNFMSRNERRREVVQEPDALYKREKDRMDHINAARQAFLSKPLYPVKKLDKAAQKKVVDRQYSDAVKHAEAKQSKLRQKYIKALEVPALSPTDMQESVERLYGSSPR